MSGDYTERVLDEINTRRLTQQAEASARERALREACPEIKALDVRIARSARHDPASVPALVAERQRIVSDWISSKGLPCDWLSPPFGCNVCGDTGYFLGRLCTCVRNEVAARLFREAGLSSESPSFESFDLSVFSDRIVTKSGRTVRDSMCFFKEMSLAYADRFPDIQKHNLLFSGPTGCGKTFLLDCIAGRIIARGYWVVRATAFGVNNIMAKAMFEKANPDSLYDCDLLALDDLGSEPVLNKVTKSSLFNLLNERAMKRKPFIISTNLTLGEILARYDERVFSRITDQRTTRIIELEGTDLRRGV